MDGWMDGWIQYPSFTVAMWVCRFFKISANEDARALLCGSDGGTARAISSHGQDKYEIVRTKTAQPALHSGDRRGELTESESSVPSRYLSFPVPQFIPSPLRCPPSVRHHFWVVEVCDWAATADLDVYFGTLVYL